MPRITWTGSLLAATLLFAESGVRAQTARSGGGSGSLLQMQLQQLASEKTRLDAENTTLKKELGQALKDLDSLRAAQKSLDERGKGSAAALAQSRNQRDASDEQLRQSKERMAELIAKFRETAQSLRDTEAERSKMQQSVVTQQRELKTCTDRNLALYELNGEVVTRLDHESFWSRAAASEPFTKLKRIENENLADDYRARAAEQRAVPLPSPPPAVKPATQ